MSNMKNLLGDMDFEEFEVVRKTVLKKLKNIDKYEIDEVYCEDGRKLYNYWLEVGGKELISKWVNNCGDYMMGDKVGECLQYMFDSFICWLESFE